MKASKTILSVYFFIVFSGLRADVTQNQRKRSLSMFPILMYDSDIGFGFGGKGVVKNQFKKNESFDLMLFGSTKGEQRYMFVFSIPDFEIRQETAYPIAFDLKIDRNKLLNSNFFGMGNDSEDNEFQFPRVMTKLDLTLGRAFTSKLIGELWYRYYHYRVYGYDPDWQTITDETPGAGKTAVSALSVRFRYDTRDSHIHPTRGMRLELQGEWASHILGGNYDFTKVRSEFSVYRQSFFRNHTIAFRFWVQHVQGDAPYWELSRVGDGQTARGYKAERFLDNAMALSSLEYRFKIYRKLGGVVFVDAGRVWPELWDFGFRDWHTNFGWGLRYYLLNFVVRFDIGISHEGTRIFFNFGHVF